MPVPRLALPYGRLAAAAKSGGAPAILHAGVKIRLDLVLDIVAASAVPGDAGPDLLPLRSLD